VFRIADVGVGEHQSVGHPERGAVPSAELLALLEEGRTRVGLQGAGQARREGCEAGGPLRTPGCAHRADLLPQEKLALELVPVLFELREVGEQHVHATMFTAVSSCRDDEWCGISTVRLSVRRFIGGRDDLASSLRTSVRRPAGREPSEAARPA
jgi:hypothetical protein